MNLAQLIQSQNFALLMQALDNAGALTAGRTVPARLLTMAPDGTATATIGDTPIALVLAGPQAQARQADLQPGATLLLRLEAPEKPGGDLRATLVEIGPATGAPPPASSIPAPTPAGLAAPANLPTAALPSGGIAGPPQPISSPAQSGGASPSALAAPAVATSAVSLSAGAAPAGSTPASNPSPVLGVDGAIRLTGADETALAPRPQAPPPPVPSASPRALLGPMLGPALQRQDSLAPLFANLRGVSEGALALALPRTMLAAADRVLAQAVPVERVPLTGPRLREAVKNSGLFMEAQAAAGRPPPASDDLKAALTALRQTLEPLIEALSPGAKTPPAGVATASQDGLAAPRPEGAAGPPPPRRDGPLAPQPAAERSIAPGETPAAIAATLLDQTDAALDRIKLTQYASLPLDAPRQEAPSPAPQRWLAEVPLAFHHGTAILPLQVERDPPRRSVEGVTPPVWRIRFALDVEPMGPLQGVVTLQGRAVGVTLWAEQEETSEMLRAAAPGLESELIRADFGSGTVDVHLGRPQIAQPTAGQFLDRLS